MRPERRPYTKKLKYRTLLTLVAAGMTMLFISVIGVQLYSASVNYLELNFSKMEQNILSQAYSMLDTQLNQVSTATGMIKNDSLTLEKIAAYDTYGVTQKNETSKHMASILYKARVINGRIAALFVFTDNNVITIGNMAVPGTDRLDYQRVFGLPGSGKASFMVPGGRRQSEDSRFSELDNCFFFSAPLMMEGRLIGILAVPLDVNFLSGALGGLGDLAVVSREGKVLYNTTVLENEELAGYYGKTGDQLPDNVLSATDQDFNGLTIFYVRNSETLARENERLRVWTLLFGGCVTLLALLIGTWFSRFITRPLNRLTEEISSYDADKIYKKSGKGRKKRGVSLREYLLCYFLVIVTSACMVFSFASYFFFSNFVEASVRKLLDSTYRQAYENVDTFFNNISNASTYFVYDPQSQQQLKKAVDSMETEVLQENYQLYLYDTDICLYNRYGFPMVATDYAMLREGNFSALAIGKRSLWNFDERSRNNRYVTYQIQINDIQTYEGIGYLKCRVNERFLENCYNMASHNGSQAFLYREDGTIISHMNKDLIGTKVNPSLLRESGEGDLVFRERLSGLPFYLVMVSDKSLISAEKGTFWNYTVYLMIIVVLSVFLAAFLLSHSLSRRLQRFSEKLNVIDLENAGLLAPEKSMVEEIDRMETAFHTMAGRIQSLLEDVIQAAEREHELELSRNRAEFSMLQAQINPHFLYNTFESINFMIRTGKKNEAITMINSLSKMLRFAARQDELTIPLEEELQYVQTYMSIMKMRYEDMLSFSVEVGPDTQGLGIIKFVLQPIIENAINHGLKPKGGYGRITVTCMAMGDQLVIVVRDDGVGMTPGQLEELQGTLRENRTATSIGLPNIHNRIRKFYGEPYGLTVTAEEGRGTAVTLLLPKVFPSGENQKKA